MDEKPVRSISEILADDRKIEKVLQKAVREALLRHKQAGNPIVEWRDGKVVWVPPEEIDLSEDNAAERES